MWKFAISKCIAWQGTQYDSSFKDFSYEDKGTLQRTLSTLQIQNNLFLSNPLDPDIQVRCSIPGSIYLISSIALVLITKYFQETT